ncbi:UNVERIFIED_ORG: hypothetical protein QOE_2057 [Clostridioides difficile F501]
MNHDQGGDPACSPSDLLAGSRGAVPTKRVPSRRGWGRCPPSEFRSEARTV